MIESEQQTKQKQSIFRTPNRKARKKVTYAALVKAVSGNEYRTLQSIGNEVGVTRERVRQLLIKYGLVDVPVRQKPDVRKICKHCKNPVEPIRNISYRSFKYPASHQKCKDLWNVNKWTEVKCTNCQTPIKILKADARFRRRIKDWLFCSYKCSATYRIKHETDLFGIWAKNKWRIVKK